MNIKFIAHVFLLLFLTLSLGACGVSDYINSKKIEHAPKYKAPAKTSQCDFTELRIQRVVNYLNNLRASPRVCGEKTYPAAPAVVWNNQLSAAAVAHSEDMAANNFLDHQGTNGLNAGARVTQSGYTWKAVAENIAGGTDTPEQTMDQWMVSAGHCQNIMNSAYKEIGLACSRDNLTDYRVYWTLVMATSMPSK